MYVITRKLTFHQQTASTTLFVSHISKILIMLANRMKLSSLNGEMLQSQPGKKILNNVYLTSITFFDGRWKNVYVSWDSMSLWFYFQHLRLPKCLPKLYCLRWCLVSQSNGFIHEISQSNVFPKHTSTVEGCLTEFLNYQL